MHNNQNFYEIPSPYQGDVYDATPEYEYAGFWIRVGASLIDGILTLLVFIPLGMVGYFLGLDIPMGYNQSVSEFDLMVNLAIAVLYVVLWVKFAGTPGHRLLKLKVLDAHTGTHLTWGRAILRYLMYNVSALVLCLGFIWIAFDKKKQGWHDKVANSVVVKEL